MPTHDDAIDMNNLNEFVLNEFVLNDDNVDHTDHDDDVSQLTGLTVNVSWISHSLFFLSVLSFVHFV